MTYNEYIKKLKREYIGKKCIYDGVCYCIIGVDYNGMLLIDKPTAYNETTAINRIQAIIKEGR